jgi:uncharacterized membrane protein (UPF0127 family)
MTRTASWATIGLLLAALVAPALLSAQVEESIRPLSAFPRERIAIETRSARRHAFDAWRADTNPTRAQGLMFVRELRPEQAMIFIYSPPQRAGMWMKNTLIPLDMLFVTEHGCIAMVKERAQPGALDTIMADVPVVLVVELAGGTAAALGIRAGDRVVRIDAGWPRDPRPCTPSN